MPRRVRDGDPHQSQVEGMMNAFGADVFARAMNYEAYTLGAEKG